MIPSFGTGHATNIFASSQKTRIFINAAFYSAPPKVVFLKVGNCTTAKILAVLRDNHHVISRFQEDQDASLLILG